MFWIKAATALTAVVTVAGCTTGGHPTTPAASQQTEPTMPAPSGSAGSGIVAKPVSTAFPLEGRDIRLVRVGEQDIALQFELFNATKQTVEPYDLGMGLIERDFKLVDIPRATAYDVQKKDGFDGRVERQPVRRDRARFGCHHHGRVHRAAAGCHEALVHDRRAAARRGTDPTDGFRCTLR